MFLASCNNLLQMFQFLTWLCFSRFSPLLPKRERRHALAPYNKSLRKLVRDDGKNYVVNIDVQQFAPEEISVKAVGDDTIIVECKHEEKPDEHGSIYRHFLRRYKLPKGHDVSKCVSKLSSDGVLTITAPHVEKNKKAEVEIPITLTNQPSQAIQHQESSETQDAEMQDVSPKKGKGSKK
ncbi:unnamed protein product [Acanthoscelides obtectus]|uniref:SHSP domain-containing protein n=1 Tax=Acanthoscelides obtectus TaxID=200917 RepID=A0A9P0JJU5_ACAOB|nr:unnamed protein product [Acanthoscelides obtectus]CAK1639671.1 Heat shock protein 26 [Acanthoscelides obtectus]